MYNERQFEKINDKKVLHKVRKQWITVSVALLSLLGSGALVAHISANADNITNNQNVTDKNNDIHNSTLTNNNFKQSLSNHINSGLANYSSQYAKSLSSSGYNLGVKLFSSQSTSNVSSSHGTARIDNQANLLHSYIIRTNNLQHHIALSKSDNISHGVWGNARYSFNYNTGSLLVIGNDMATSDNINANGGINTISTVRIPNGYPISSSQYKSDAHRYPTNDIHYNISPSDIKSITFKNDNLVQLPEDSSYMFAGLPNLTNVNLTGMYTRNDITSVNHMFADDPKLRSVVLNDNFSTGSIHDMQSMFASDPELTSINFGTNFNTDHVSNLSNMFINDGSLNSVNVQFNVKSDANVQNMFKNSGLQSLDLSKFNITNPSEANGMLQNMSNLQVLTLGPDVSLIMIQD